MTERCVLAAVVAVADVAAVALGAGVAAVA